MSVLSFTPAADSGNYQATFAVSSAYLLQMTHTSDKPVHVTIKARLDASMPWAIIKVIPTVGQSVILPMQASENMQVMLEVNDSTLRAAFAPVAAVTGGGASGIDLTSLQAELSRQSTINDEQQQQINANTQLNSAQEAGLGETETTQMLNSVFGQ